MEYMSGRIHTCICMYIVPQPPATTCIYDIMSALYPGVFARFYFIEVCDFLNTVLFHIHRFYLITVSCVHFSLRRVTHVETEKTVIRVHRILVYLCGFYYLYREGLDTVFVSHSPDLHNHCLVFVPSLQRVAHVEREERRIITTVMKCA